MAANEPFHHPNQWWALQPAFPIWMELTGPCTPIGWRSNPSHSLLLCGHHPSTNTNTKNPTLNRARGSRLFLIFRADQSLKLYLYLISSPRNIRTSKTCSPSQEGCWTVDNGHFSRCATGLCSNEVRRSQSDVFLPHTGLQSKNIKVCNPTQHCTC